MGGDGMANQNKSFLTEEERGVLTPTSVRSPRDARERFFEVEGNIEAVLKYVPTNTKKVNDN
jgi:hypothetical protein